MKRLSLIAILLFASPVFGYEVIMRVVDDQGRSVSNADVEIIFAEFVQGSDKIHAGKTDRDGVFRAEGRARDSVYLTAGKSGHYAARLERLSKDKDLDITVVIPRILKPVPLYAWDSRMGAGIRSAHFPAQNEWLGFDFEAADWVAPHGRGKVADIQFRFRNEFKGYADDIKDLEKAIAFSQRGYAARREPWTEEKFKRDAGKWDAELEISFPGEKEGLYEETTFWHYNQMKMPHQAPEEGYVPSWRYTANTYSPPSARERVGFFLRTRVKLDEAGNIVSANYAKVVGDFHLDARGFVMFCYYFNPVPNDRNLEFDPKRNLFPAGFPGSFVQEP